MIKISIVSYLNTIPFVYGLRKSEIFDIIDLQLDYPSICSQKLLNGEVDLALVPIVVIPKLKDSHIISNYCIGANGAVETVCLYAEVPINEIETISLDYQSQTSVALLRILLKEYWHLNPKLKNSEVGFENEISAHHAALVIGDRAFDLNKKHRYVYDLSALWKEMTGLPFVFAAWVSNKNFSQKFIADFNKALEIGLSDIDNALIQEGSNYINFENPEDYLNNKISYNLDSSKLEAMDCFFKKIRS